jgi:solute carrier family 25 folate transporter 32
LAGAAADIICNPMFVVRTRLQTEALHGTVTPSGIFQTVRALHAEGGPLIFWRGMTASLFGLTHVAVQFPLYEWLKERSRKHSPDGKETPMDVLVASGLSKMCASLLTYPHEVVRSRMMDARTGQSLTSTIQRIYAHEGIHGFYTGLHVSLLRVVPNCCITFLSYEMLLRWARHHIEQNDNTNESWT